MTICIAAICDSGKALVVGADRELTVSGISLKFDHNEKKIVGLTEKCVVLGSGESPWVNEILRRTKEQLSGVATIRQMAELLRNVFMSNHIERVENVILKPLGYSFSEFKEKAASQMPLDIYKTVHNLIFSFGINVVEFLIAGCDDSGAHIYRVFYMGMAGGDWLEWCDQIGYRCIGSGYSHAFISLTVAGQHSSLTREESLYNVYCAKKTAELSPGVGQEGDFAVISSTGIEFIDKSKINDLENKRKKKA